LKKPLEENVFDVEKVVLDKASEGGCSKLAMLKLEKDVTGQRFAMKLPKQEMNSTWLCRTLGWGRMYFVSGFLTELEGSVTYSIIILIEPLFLSIF